MVLHLIRTIFVLAVLAITISFASSPDVMRPVGEEIISPVTKVTLAILIPVVLAVVLILVDMGSRTKSLGSISGLFFGVVAGAVLAYILGMVVELVASIFMPTAMTYAAAPEANEPPALRRAAGAPPTTASAAWAKPVTTTSAPAAPADAPDRIVVELRADRRGQPAGVLAAETPGMAPSQRSAMVAMIKLLVGAFTIYLCVSFVMQTKDDFRFIIPYVEFAKQSKGSRPMLLDTSVIIDGRIADVADTRVLESPMIVPRFVLEEVQNLADSSDKLRRNRGRRGLDVLNRLRGNDRIEVRLMDARVQAVEEVKEVDHKLVALAQHMDGRIVTNDYNLNKVAQLRGVEVININDLANALKPVFLPGENISVKIIKPGEESGQGVGYLDDGTMIVIEQGREHLGHEVPILVTSTLQTSAGRMIFGRVDLDRLHAFRPAPGNPPGNGPSRPA